MRMICVLDTALIYDRLYVIRYGILLPQFRVREVNIPQSVSIRLPFRNDFHRLKDAFMPEEWIIEYMQVYLKQT